MKTRAYLYQTSKKSVTAWSVAKERIHLHRGEPTGQTYYSIHPAGQRKQMAHVHRKDCAPHFKYVNAADEHSGGAGESLQHLLFKEAVAAITGTTLALKKFGNHRIKVLGSELEKGIDHPESLRRADVFLKFESETDLGFKWGGVLYVEIRRSHAVEKEKLDIVRSLRLPMVEVSIPESILYQYDDETTTDEREAQYVNRIKKMLEGATGFLGCEVLNNPSTLEYLERQVPLLWQQGAELESARDAAESRATALLTSNELLEANVHTLAQQLGTANDRAVRSEEGLVDAKRIVAQLRKDLTELSNEVAELQELQNDWHIDGRWVLAAFAVLVLIIGAVQYFRR